MSHTWAAGLIKTINDKKNVIISSNIAVVIADKYPKAHQHYLVLPTADIANIFQLTRADIPLLEELHLLACNIIELKNEKMGNFKIGFHAQPSMERLHLHVISKDFNSVWLKTKKHWNSFNTAFFVPYTALYDELETKGSITRLDKLTIEKLLKTDLKCNQCDFIAKNMPILKQHLTEHT